MSFTFGISQKHLYPLSNPLGSFSCFWLKPWADLKTFLVTFRWWTLLRSEKSSQETSSSPSIYIFSALTCTTPLNSVSAVGKRLDMFRSSVMLSLPSSMPPLLFSVSTLTPPVCWDGRTYQAKRYWFGIDANPAGQGYLWGILRESLCSL